MNGGPSVSGPVVRMIAAGSTCGVQKIGWISAELRGSATKSQPPSFSEFLSDSFGKAPGGYQVTVCVPIIGVTTQELPSKIAGGQLIDVVIGGLGPPIFIFGHPSLPLRKFVQRELCGRYDSRLNEAGEGRSGRDVMRFAHHLNEGDTEEARRSRFSSSISRGRDGWCRRARRAPDRRPHRD